MHSFNNVISLFQSYVENITVVWGKHHLHLIYTSSQRMDAVTQSCVGFNPIPYKCNLKSFISDFQPSNSFVTKHTTTPTKENTQDANLSTWDESKDPFLFVLTSLDDQTSSGGLDSQQG